MKDGKCEMKGFLSFIVLWLINKKPSTGAEISKEIEKRKGSKPSPGTIYPVLKELKEKGLLKEDNKKYSLTSKGKKELNISIDSFFCLFDDLDEMKKCCDKK